MRVPAHDFVRLACLKSPNQPRHRVLRYADDCKILGRDERQVRAALYEVPTATAVGFKVAAP